MSFNIQAIGYVRGGRAELTDDNWGTVSAMIELVEDFSAEAFAGLSSFSHAEIVFIFDRVPEAKIERGARHPRGREDWPLVGIFAQRGKNRPNRIGLTIVEIIKVDEKRLFVSGLDAVDGTPVIDIKPLMKGFLPRKEVDEPEWANALMAEYW